LSPHLDCVRAIPERNGALFLRGESDASSLRQALSTSVTRRTAHASGRYVPTRYYMVWPRAALLGWHREDRGT
jgi:hypothetical protein